MNDNLKILVGDAVEQMRELPADSIQCCVTSPPYDVLRSYGGFQWNFEDVAHEIYHRLCPGGILCWNIGDSMIEGSESLTSCKQKIYFQEKVGFKIHDTMIYEKLNFSHPERTRYHQVFEYVFILSKNRPRCFNPIKDKRNSTAGCVGNLGINTFTERNGTKSVRAKKLTAEFGMRGNVWKGKTRGQEEMCERLPHPAMMPKWLVRDLILSWSNSGDTILDPFGGSGTTGMVALELGRKAILCELNPDYVELIKQRTNITPGLALA